MGALIETPGFQPGWSGARNLAELARLQGFSRAEARAEAGRWIDRVGLAGAGEKPVQAYSQGMRQRLGLAQALLGSPRYLLLDEPTNGVDPVSRRELWALLYELVDDGVGVLVATPYMDEAARCTRLLLLAEGTVLAEGTPSTLVATLDDPVLDVGPGATREALESIEAHPGVLATAPSGDGVRLLVAKERAPEVAKLLDALRLASRTADPTLEDLFLSKMQRRRAGAKS